MPFYHCRIFQVQNFITDNLMNSFTNFSATFLSLIINMFSSFLFVPAEVGLYEPVITVSLSIMNTLWWRNLGFVSNCTSNPNSFNLLNYRIIKFSYSTSQTFEWNFLTWIFFMNFTPKITDICVDKNKYRKSQKY